MKDKVNSSAIGQNYMRSPKNTVELNENKKCIKKTVGSKF